jgi:hypothetical protein
MSFGLMSRIATCGNNKIINIPLSCEEQVSYGREDIIKMKSGVT